MVYKKNLPKYGRGFGAPPKSGYIGTRDFMAPYRQPSMPESDYFRRVKESIRASEVKGPSGFSDLHPRYISQLPKKSSEPTIWRGYLQEFAESVLKDAIKEIEEKTGAKEVPQQRYEQLRDAAVGSTEAIDYWMKRSEKTLPDNPDFFHEMKEIKKKTENDMKEITEVLEKREETIVKDPVEFLKDPSILGEPDDIKEKWSQWKMEQEKSLSEENFDDINFWKESGKLDYIIEKIESELNNLERRLDVTRDQIENSGIGEQSPNVLQNETESTIKSEQVENTLPSLTENYADLPVSNYTELPDNSFITQRKKASLGYDSEVDAM